MQESLTGGPELFLFGKRWNIFGGRELIWMTKRIHFIQIVKDFLYIETKSPVL